MNRIVLAAVLSAARRLASGVSIKQQGQAAGRAALGCKATNGAFPMRKLPRLPYLPKVTGQIPVLLVCLIGILLSGALCGCGGGEVPEGYTYVVGVSLANNMEPWINYMADELLRELRAYSDDINLIFREAGGSPEKQARDIEALKQDGIDLLIVAPGDPVALKSALADVEQTLPVIVVGSRVEEELCTSMILFDDYGIGKLAGNYILEQLYQQGDKLVILEGTADSLISAERHRGLCEALSGRIPEGSISFYYGEWLSDKAGDRIRDYLTINARLNTVFAFNNEMAYGADLAAKELLFTHVRYVGVNESGDESEGRDLIRDGILDADVSCPGLGSATAKTAIRLLQGEQVEKELILSPKLLTRE